MFKNKETGIYPVSHFFLTNILSQHHGIRLSMSLNTETRLRLTNKNVRNNNDHQNQDIGSPIHTTNSHPMPSKPHLSFPALLNIVLLAFFLILYISTLAPDILPADNGEYQLAAATLGVAHPPGYPLHTMLGALMARLPLGEIPGRVNLLSALLAAGTLVLISMAVNAMTGRPLAGLAAAVALGTGTTFWAQAAMSNVRTPAAFLTALAVYALVKHQAEVERGGRKNFFLYLFAASLALGLSHHFSLVFIDLFLVLGLFLIDKQLVRQPRRWAGLVLVVLVCLLPLIYLPLRAPETLGNVQGFIHYVLALGFSGDFLYFHTPAALLSRLGVMTNVMAFQFHPLILVGGTVSLFVGWKRRRLNLVLAGGFLLHTLATATYRAPQTVEYMLPALVPFAVLFGAGLAWAGNRMVGKQLPAGGELSSEAALSVDFLIYPMLLVLFLLAGLAQGINHYPSFRALASNRDTRNTLYPIMTGAPADAIILADWHWFKPMCYLQQVEGVRPDLSIEYVAPTGEPYEETWARRIREELPNRPVVVTHYNELAYAGIPAVFEPLGEAFLVRSEPRRALPDDFISFPQDFGGTITLLGYRWDVPPAALDAPFSIVLAWTPGIKSPATLFVHLVGANGELYAQQDVVLDLLSIEPGDVALTRFDLAPRTGALPGRYNLMVGAYTPDGSLQTGTGETRVVLASAELGPSTTPLYTRRPRQEKMGNNVSLVGVDWDLSVAGESRLYLHWRAKKDAPEFSYTLNSEDDLLAAGSIPSLPAGSFQTTAHTLPTFTGNLILIPQTPAHKKVRIPAAEESETYIPYGAGIIYLGSQGIPKTLDSLSFKPRLHFAASYPILRDYVVSTSLIGLNTDGTWAWRELDDGVPAMGAIPTLKWIAGSQIIDPHDVNIPDDAPAGAVLGTLSLYDAFTGRQLPLLDERLAAVAPWAPLGRWVLQPE